MKKSLYFEYNYIALCYFIKIVIRIMKEFLKNCLMNDW